MWITKRIAAAATPKTVERGQTSIGGEETAVALRGEQRGIEVMAPGGYVWRPRCGDEVLVIKDSVSGESVAAAAKMSPPPKGMEDGEVCISTNGASIFLRNDGRIKIYGNIILYGSFTYGEEEEEEEEEDEGGGDAEGGDGANGA